MRNEFDDHATGDDMARDFWGEPTGRRAGTPPAGIGRRNMGADATTDRPVTSALGAVKDSWAAFKPHGADRTGAMPRTRQHGVVDPNRPLTPPHGSQRRSAPPKNAPNNRRKRVAKNDLSISDLGSGRAAELSLDAWDAIDDWSELDDLTARHEAQRASRQYRDHIKGVDRSADLRVRPSGGGSSAQRQSGSPAPVPAMAGFVERSSEVDRDDWDDYGVDFGDAHHVPVASQIAEKIGWRGADPLLVKALGAALLSLFLLPFFFAGRGGNESEQAADALPVTAQLADVPVAGSTTSTTVVNEDSTSAGSTDTELSASVEERSGDEPGASSSDSSGDASSNRSSGDSSSGGSTSGGSSGDSRSGDSGDDSSGSDDGKASPPPECDESYDAVDGDSWWGIADRAGVSLDDLLDENNATADTVILPGREICLPAGASDPSDGTTTTTSPDDDKNDDDENDDENDDKNDDDENDDKDDDKNDDDKDDDGDTTTTTTPSTDAPTTTTTTTTSPPTTTTSPPPSGSPGKGATPEQVKQVIRDVFPAELEAKALDIAYKESRYRPTAYNGWCCHGVFQIYYKYHTDWLPSIGVNSVDDLYDPVLNAKAALEIYRRAGNSWSPWTTA